MEYHIVNFSEISKINWDNFVENTSSSFLWHDYDFINAKNTWDKHSNVSFALANKNENILGIFPVYKIGFCKYRIFRKAYLDNIGGWLVSSENSEKLSTILLNEFKNRLDHFSCTQGCINFSTTSLNYTENPFYSTGEEIQTAQISVIDLSKSLDVVWSLFRKGHKSEIKKAEKNGITYREANPDDLDTYYKMHEYVCSKSSIKPHNKEYFSHIFRKLLPQKKALIGIAYLGDCPIAAVNYGLHKDKAVYWTGASFPESYRLGASHFLHWNMIQELKKKNFLWLDMGEVFSSHASAKIQGISDFKSGFGGNLRPCFKSIIEI